MLRTFGRPECRSVTSMVRGRRRRERRSSRNVVVIDSNLRPHGEAAQDEWSGVGVISKIRTYSLLMSVMLSFFPAGHKTPSISDVWTAGGEKKTYRRSLGYMVIGFLSGKNRATPITCRKEAALAMVAEATQQQCSKDSCPSPGGILIVHSRCHGGSQHWVWR